MKSPFTAFILMCGRLGGFAGSNLVGVLLAGMCTSIFYVNGALLLSELRITARFPNHLDAQFKTLFLLVLQVAFFCF